MQVLICRSVKRRHFPHSGNSTDCGRPVYDDDDDHDDCGAGHSDDGDEEEDNNASSPLGEPDRLWPCCEEKTVIFVNVHGVIRMVVVVVVVVVRWW